MEMEMMMRMRIVSACIKSSRSYPMTHTLVCERALDGIFVRGRHLVLAPLKAHWGSVHKGVSTVHNLPMKRFH